MSFLDDLKNTPTDPTNNGAAKPSTPFEETPNIGAIVEYIKNRCIRLKKEGIHSLSGSPWTSVDISSDGDGGWIEGESTDILGPLVTVQNAQKDAAARYQSFISSPSSLRVTSFPKEGFHIFIDSWGRTGANHGQPYLFRYRENAGKVCRDLRDELVRLGFPDNCVRLTELQNLLCKETPMTLFGFGDRITFVDTGEKLYTASVFLNW